jgi:hypothetical protein
MKKLLLLLSLFTIGFVHSQNINLSNLTVFEGEPYIAINPTNNQNIVVAWMGYVFGSGTALTIKTKKSIDGGQTWSTAVNLPHMSPNFKSADVSIAFDGTGKLFLTYIDYRESPDSGGVYLTKSLNGGTTWSTPVKVIDALTDGTKRPIDRPWLSVSNSGNNIYVTTKPAPWILPPNRPYFISSSNGGTSFNNWRYLDTTNFLVGNVIAAPMAVPAVTGNTVIAIYPSYLPSQSVFAKYILAKSTNGGGTFNYSTVFNSSFNTAAANDSAKLSYRLIINPTNSNHYVFVCIGSLSGVDYDIYMTETLNGGSSWSALTRINDDTINNGKMQDLLWTDFDNNGDLAITWRDRRNGSGPGYARASEIYAAFRPSGSSTFNPNFKISNTLETYGNILSENGNDVMSMVIKNDTLHTVWGSTRDGSLDIWYSRTKASIGGTTDIKLLNSESLIINTIPNPTTDHIMVSVNNKTKIDLLEIYSVSGKLIHSQKNNDFEIKLDLKHFADGIYQLKIQQGNLVSYKKIIKQ